MYDFRKFFFKTPYIHEFKFTKTEIKNYWLTADFSKHTNFIEYTIDNLQKVK